MKQYSVYNAAGDEIKVSKDMLEFYSGIGWTVKQEPKRARSKSADKESE